MDSLVYPGSFLSTEEEFFPLENCYSDSGGSVYSDSVGEKSFDLEEKTVLVAKKTRQVSMISRGDTVIARVSLVKEQAVIAEILEALDQKNPSRKIVFGSSSAVLPVFMASNSFLKYLGDFFKVGDILKARVDSISAAGIELETKSNPEYGIIVAFCTVCRQSLLDSGNKLACKNCANIESRKISSEYMLK